MPSSSHRYRVEFFIPRKGISATVLKRDLASYIGDAEVRPTKFEGREGFMIKANKPLDKHQLADLKANSIRLEAERASVDGYGTATEPRPSREHRSHSSTFQDHSYQTAAIAGSHGSDRRERAQSTPYGNINIQAARLAHGLAQSRRPNPTYANSYTDSPGPTLGRSSYFPEYEESDSGYGSRQDSSSSFTQSLPSETQHRHSDESSMPAIDSLQLGGRRRWQGSEDGSYVSTRDDPFRRSYISHSQREPHHALDEDAEGVVAQSGSRSRAGYGRNVRTAPARPYYDEREIGLANRRVLFDEADSTTRAEHVVRDPREPVRRRSTRPSEDSRRMREFAEREDADERATFRRERSRDRLRYEEEGEDDEEGDYHYTSRSGNDLSHARSRHSARDRRSGAYRPSYPDDRILTGRDDDDDERDPPWGSTPGFNRCRPRDDDDDDDDDDDGRDPPWGQTPGFRRHDS